nr:MAG TPA: hypothetical protein [Caudoviricetes sp.]
MLFAFNSLYCIGLSNCYLLLNLLMRFTSFTSQAGRCN